MNRSQRIKRKQKDMYHHGFVCFGGLFFIVLSPFYLYYVFTDSLKWLFAFLPWFGFGAWAFLSWLNYGAWMTSESTFIYRTFYGRKKEYRFSEIRDIQFGHKGAMTLILENGTIPIDGGAVLSYQFGRAVNAALRENLKQGYKVIPYKRYIDH